MEDTLRQNPSQRESDTDLASASTNSQPISTNLGAIEMVNTVATGGVHQQPSQPLQNGAMPPDAATSPAKDDNKGSLEGSGDSIPPALGPRLEVPGYSDGDQANDHQSTTKVITRRKKTITKTPHTFELADDLQPTASTTQAEAQPPSATEDLTTTPKKPVKRRSRPVDAAASPYFAFSPVRTTLDLHPIDGGPTSPRRPKSTVAPKNPFTAPASTDTTWRQSSSLSQTQGIGVRSNPCRFTPPALNPASFSGKVVVLTHGASLIGRSIVRHFHGAGSRVVFGDPNPEQARKFVGSLGPPHIVHFNRCDVSKYEDMLELFKLAMTMYGRVDHAIFGVGDDGAQVGTVGEGEKEWFESLQAAERTAKAQIDEVQIEPVIGLGDTLGASVRFARIALAYLKHMPKTKSKRRTGSGGVVDSATVREEDKSVTFVTSVAAFKETPGLPIYQTAQHGILGLVRSLSSSIDLDRDRVRVNAVITNIMIARAMAQVDGRISVQLPPDRPEDVSRVVVGIAAAGSGSGDEHGPGAIWYEKGSERVVTERDLHGRVIYAVGEECWDMQEGLDMSEIAWLGLRPSEALKKTQEGLGRGSQWILDVQYPP